MTAKWVAAALVMAPVSAQYTGAPYSAVETSELTKTLLNGTHITQTFRQQLLYRDSHGRTRTEILPVIPYSAAAPPAASGPASPATIIVVDPVDGFRYTIYPKTKHVLRTQIPRSSGVLSTEIATFKGGAKAPGPQPPQRGPAGEAAIVTSLGTQTINGLIADGSKIDTTYPIGRMGNDREIVITIEYWRSRDLNIQLLTKQNDPRQGETVTQLTGISRTEPDPALFTVPSGYTVEDRPLPVPQAQ